MFFKGGGVIENPTKLEKAAGSLPIEAGSTLLAAIVGGPLAPLLPLLTKSLASKRHERRVVSAIKNVEERLGLIEASLEDLTDAQYKFVNEGVLTLFQTTDEEKVKMLVDAIAGVVDVDLSHDESIVISRTVRDLSVSELKLLMSLKGRGVVFREADRENVLFVENETATHAHGLISLGLLWNSRAGLISDLGMFSITPLGERILDVFLRFEPTPADLSP